MADKKVSDLSAATTVAAADLFLMVVTASMTTKKITFANLVAAIVSSISDGAITARMLASNSISLGRATVTASINHTNTETTIASVAVTVPAGGRDLKLRVIAPQIQSNVAGDRILLQFKEGSTVLAKYYHSLTLANKGQGEVFEASIPAPAAGSHTYTLTSQRDQGTGTIIWFADTSGANLTLLAELA